MLELNTKFLSDYQDTYQSNFYEFILFQVMPRSNCGLLKTVGDGISMPDAAIELTALKHSVVKI